MKVIETRLPGVLIFEPRVFGDARGFFVETFRQNLLDQYNIPAFVQENQSRSKRGVLRGLHYQLVQAQGKLVRASRGRVFDVAVDIRKESPTFGVWVGAELDDCNHRQMYIPPNFAHGFVVLSDEADFAYKCTNYYHPESENGIAWNDAKLAIDWPSEILQKVVLSDKDQALPNLGDQLAENLPTYRA